MNRGSVRSARRSSSPSSACTSTVSDMNDAQKALLARLRELVVVTPTSGALNAAKRPLHITRFAQAVERRSEDGAKLVAYVRAKVHEPVTGGYESLIDAGRADLT